MGKVDSLTYVNIYQAGGALLQIGNNVGLEPFVSIICKLKIEIGDNTVLAPGVVVTDFDHDLTDPNRIREDGIREPVKIGNNVWIGANSVVLKGVKIGNNAVIGAGSIVTHDIPEGEIWVGNPAHFLRKR